MLDSLIAIRLIRLMRMIPTLLKMVEIDVGTQSVMEKDVLIATNCN